MVRRIDLNTTQLARLRVREAAAARRYRARVVIRRQRDRDMAAFFAKAPERVAESQQIFAEEVEDFAAAIIDEEPTAEERLLEFLRGLRLPRAGEKWRLLRVVLDDGSVVYRTLSRDGIVTMISALSAPGTEGDLVAQVSADARERGEADGGFHGRVVSWGLVDDGGGGEVDWLDEANFGLGAPPRRAARVGAFYPKVLDKRVFPEATRTWLFENLQLYCMDRTKAEIGDPQFLEDFKMFLKGEGLDLLRQQCFVRAVTVALSATDHPLTEDEVARLNDVVARSSLSGKAIALDQITSILHAAKIKDVVLHVKHDKNGRGDQGRLYDGVMRRGRGIKPLSLAEARSSPRYVQLGIMHAHYFAIIPMRSVESAPQISERRLAQRVELLREDPSLTPEELDATAPLNKPRGKARDDLPCRDTWRFMTIVLEREGVAHDVPDGVYAEMHRYAAENPKGHLAAGITDFAAFCEPTSPFDADGENNRWSAKYALDFETWTRHDDDASLNPYMAAWKHFNKDREFKHRIPSAPTATATKVSHGRDCADEFLAEIERAWAAPKADPRYGFSYLPRSMSRSQQRYFSSLMRRRAAAASSQKWSERDDINAKLAEIVPVGFNIRVFAHNSKFDIPFLATAAVARGWRIEKRLVNGNGVVLFNLKHHALHINLQIRDSCRIVGGKGVAALPKMFGFDVDGTEKGLMLHAAVTKSLIDPETGALSNAVPLPILRKAVETYNAKPENAADPFDWQEWESLLKPFQGSIRIMRGAPPVRMIRFRDYVEKYCVKDVDIVCEAMTQFDTLLNGLYEVSAEAAAAPAEAGLSKQNRQLPTDAYSAASIADSFFKAAHVYDDVVGVEGALKHFLRGFIHGGRCTLPLLTHANKPFRLVQNGTRYAYLDAVSLYPSAMKELARFPTGMPERLAGACASAETLMAQAKAEQWQAYFAVCRVKDTAGEPRQLPFGLYPVRTAADDDDTVDPDQAISWQNDLRGIPRVYFDSVSLPDFLEGTRLAPCDIEVVDVIFFPKEEEVQSARARRELADAVQSLFELRLKAKADGNTALSEVVKLLLNSAYGRLVLKPTDTNEVIRTGHDEMMASLHQNLGRVKQAASITFEPDPKDRTYSILMRNKVGDSSAARYHAGALVLSQSRRIMNRVMYAAVEAGCGDRMYYTDTDSLCLVESDIPHIEAVYNRIYPDLPPLQGKHLGQFHTDFPDLPGAKHVWSEEAIILGKKAYCHRLRGDNGATGFKYSLKGVSEKAIALKCKELKTDVWGIFEKLFAGEKVEFDLAAGGKCRFVYGNCQANPSMRARQERHVVRGVRFD